MKQFFRTYKHAVPLILYGIFYLCWFVYLEQRTGQYHQIHMSVDDLIPFCEIFIIPYMLWFAYVSAVVLYLFFQDKNGYFNACVFLFTGMTLFLIVSTLYPNGHQLRPAVLPRDNIFTQAVSALWRIDAPLNLFPSIHVYNSLGAHFAVLHCKKLAHHRKIRISSGILCASIILSTVFIKQHSVFDVLTAFGMAAVMYVLVYKYFPAASWSRQLQLNLKIFWHSL